MTALPRLEEITIMVRDNLLAPAANPILPSLRLPSARRVFLKSLDARGAPSTPILPLSFEDRLPSLSVVPKAFVALDEGCNGITFYGLDDSKFTLYIHFSAPYAFTQSTFGGLPLDSVRTLQVSFRSPSTDTTFFVDLLRFMEGLQRLELKRNTVGPLNCWIGLDQTGICPALATLIITDEEAKESVEALKRVRERAGVPIANVEIRDD